MANKGIILVGTIGQGVMMSADDGESWTRASVRQGMHSDCIVRALLSDARWPNVVYAGTDMGLYQSDDGGAHWRLLDTPMKGSMVWSMAIDPVDPNVMFAGTGTPSKPGIYRTTDAGKTWEAARAREIFPWHYPRGIAVKPNDPRTVFVTLGDTAPGRIGTVMRSRDAGATWQSLGLPVQPNSAVWTVSMPASAPETVLAASRYGYLYRSDDGGDSWRKLWREFGEVSSILWVPQAA